MENLPKTKAETSGLKWSSRIDFIVSLIGYSFGLSDIWRVPYLTYRNGGGAFLIPYVFALLVCGIPLLFLEIMMSQFSGKGTWAVWDFCPLFRGIGISFLILNWIVTIYAPIQQAWTIEYLTDSFHSVLPWSTCDNEWNTPACVTFGKQSNLNKTYPYNISIENRTLFPSNTSVVAEMESSVEQYWNNKVLQISNGIDDFGPINWKYVLYVFLIYVITWISLVKSIQSFAKMMYVTCLAPIVLTVIIWIRALMLPGAAAGMLYFIYPDFDRLCRIEVWIEAGFMAFYTLGPAWGGLAVYGSHNRFHDNCYRDSVITVVVTIAYGLLNGLVTFSVIGVMAAETGIDISKVITSGGFSLGFVVYPKAITYFPLPQLWSVLLFIILLLPGLDAQAILLEPVLCVIEERFPEHIGKRRIPLLTVMILSSFILGLPFATKAGVYMFQLIDWYIASFSVLLIALIESVLFAWTYGGDRISRDVKIMLGRQLPSFVRVTCAFLTPLFLLVLVASSVFKFLPPKYGSYIYPRSAISIGWCFSIVTIVPFLLWILYAVWKEKGFVLKRIQRLLKPLPSWGPCEPKYRKIYDHSELCNKRSFKSLLLFNISGRGGMTVTKEVHELTG